MYQPQELEVWYIIPAIRKALTEKMLKKGLKQVEIAKKLDIAESAVSHYLKSKRACKVKFSKEIDKAIDESVNNILNGKNATREIQNICEKIRKTKLICDISKKLGKAPKNCEVCFK